MSPCITNAHRKKYIAKQLLIMKFKIGLNLYLLTHYIKQGDVCLRDD